MWRKHFEHLYNSVKNGGAQQMFFELLLTSNNTNSQVSVEVHDVCDAINKQKLGKAIGPDGIAMEALLFGGDKLVVHICFLFNMFLKFGFLPKNFVSSVIVPLVECKSGDLTDVNNYRAIAISSALSLRFLNISLLLIYLLLLKVIVFSLGSSLVIVQHSALVFLSVLLSTILTEEVTFLFVSLTSVKHLTRLITGSFLINFWMIILIFVLLMFLHIGFQSRS
jgi:hypothetical protein